MFNSPCAPEVNEAERLLEKTWAGQKLHGFRNISRLPIDRL
jgi:hypothetical protein